MSSTTIEPPDSAPAGLLGGEMSFLDHLEELRRRLTRSVAFVGIAFLLCWFASSYIYTFLSRPVIQALAEAQQRPLPLGGMTGYEQIVPIARLAEGDRLRFVFVRTTTLGASVIPEGASVLAHIGRDGQGRPGLFTDEALTTGEVVIPRGVRLPTSLDGTADVLVGADSKLVVNTVMESFSLYVKVSLYAAFALSLPFLLYQIWAFVAPGLYPHERSYALPFVALSTVSFVLGAAFAYYIAFPPAARYLLGLGQDFQLLLKATDYFDFIILIMLSMGLVFQMPAITYILARIGLVTAGFLIRSWRLALIIIFILAAVLSPTADVLNMMLFAAPMSVLYLISIVVAWGFGKPREIEEEA